MTRVVFIEHSGTEHVVEAEDGKSLMQTAVDNMVPGIVGDCGGCCTCATCHVYVDEPWFSRLHAADEMELGMLEGAIEPQPRSRLSCQIKITEKLDGLVAHIPAGQL